MTSFGFVPLTKEADKCIFGRPSTPTGGCGVRSKRSKLKRHLTESQLCAIQRLERSIKRSTPSSSRQYFCVTPSAAGQNQGVSFRQLMANSWMFLCLASLPQIKSNLSQVAMKQAWCLALRNPPKKKHNLILEMYGGKIWRTYERKIHGNVSAKVTSLARRLDSAMHIL